MNLSYLFVGFATLVSLSAQATLGEGESSISKVEALQGVVRQTSTTPQYTVQTMASTAYTIKEYQRPDGRIFAVTWKGMSRPDLKIILGSYYGEYSAAHAEKMRRSRSRQMRVTSASLVVVHGGHMRNLTGLAYDPSLVPAGVSAEALQ